MPEGRYFLVVDRASNGRFVAGFGEVALAVAFAREAGEADRALALAVVDAGDGVEVFPEGEVQPEAAAARPSFVRMRPEPPDAGATDETVSGSGPQRDRGKPR